MRMLGKATLHDRGKHFDWCCVGHDHTNATYVKVHRKTQRQRERRTWKREAYSY